jgi:predicted transcriptional regulator
VGRFKIHDIDNESFYQIPKSLFTNENYIGLGNDAKIIYAFLKDRMELSRKNSWKDENGDIYLLFTQEEIASLLDVSLSTVTRAMKRLKQYDLIEIIRQGLSKPNKIYINKTCVDRPIKTSKVDQSRHVNLTSRDTSNLHANDTEYIETDSRETEKSIKTSQPKCSFAEFVTMTNDEYSSLVVKLGSEEAAQRCIELLDNYKGANGKKYKNDYRAILSWVIQKYREEQLRENTYTPSGSTNPQAEMARRAIKILQQKGQANES